MSKSKEDLQYKMDGAVDRLWLRQSLGKLRKRIKAHEAQERAFLRSKAQPIREPNSAENLQD